MDDWHVLTQSRGGTVSLIKNVSRETAKEMVDRLTPRYVSGAIYPDSDSDLVRVEAFGPAGETIGGRC